MDEHRTRRAEYHHQRREIERRRAARAADARARRSHAELAKLHDLELMRAYLPPRGE